MKSLDNDAILYCDNHLLAVNKPSGLPTQGDESLTTLAKAWVKEKFKKPGRVFLEPIHRLDKPVSGIVLFARTSKALSRLQEQQRARTIRKIYRARVEKAPQQQEATLEHNIEHGDHRAHILKEGGKRAILHYKTVGKNLLEIELLTGRYHQIRAQLSAIGCPIVGDAKYGAKSKSDKISLHHARMEFVHPVKGEVISITCRFPKS